ncbi:polysaccharide biosynthesis/export family protein [Reyranella sp.]|jgi:polysaccharide export outer membrane protein|uniref:polysaccharide biosynthesis/export family protein n=1 Tax=Reyranella sp. TaxID=1929291 RepID=UPI002F95E7A2
MSSGSISTTLLLRCCAIAATLALGACGYNDPTPIVPDNSAAAGSLNLAPNASGGTQANSADYRLGPNDRTRIIVFGQPNLTGEFQLDGNGVLAFPLIGNVDANGMTPRELQQAIANKLDPQYMHNPSVSVEVSTRRPFYVVGEVQKPGSYPFVTDLTLLQAISTAGGETYRANMSSFYIKRRVNGQIVRVAATQESEIQPGDTVIVRERYF